MADLREMVVARPDLGISPKTGNRDSIRGESVCDCSVPKRFVGDVRWEHRLSAFAGTLPNGIEASMDGGNSWFGTGLENTGISSLGVSPNGYVFAGGYQGAEYSCHRTAAAVGLRSIWEAFTPCHGLPVQTDMFLPAPVQES